jgi:hypothetical protein
MTKNSMHIFAFFFFDIKERISCFLHSVENCGVYNVIETFVLRFKSHIYFISRFYFNFFDEVSMFYFKCKFVSFSSSKATKIMPIGTNS